MIDDGGPAFSIAYQHVDTDGSIHTQRYPGMSLLDWFAGQALPIVMQERPPADCITAEKAAELAAKISYEFAAAMIARRKHFQQKSS